MKRDIARWMRRLELALGLGGQATHFFIEEMADRISPLLNELEAGWARGAPSGLDQIKKIFQNYFLQWVGERQDLDWQKFQKLGQEFLGIVVKTIRPAPILKGLWGLAQSKWRASGLGTVGHGTAGVDEFGMDPNTVEAVKPIFEFLYTDYWHVSTKGIRNIPTRGRALLVANHSGTVPYDGAMIAVAVARGQTAKRTVRFLVEDFVYHFPFLGTFIHRIGGVRACPENATWLLEKENLVTVFPEGVKGIGKLYRERYQLQRFGRGGFVKLALKTSTPIIPVAVIGAEEIHPILWKSSILAKPLGIPYLPVTPTFPWLGPLGLIPLPTKWQIHFGKPIVFKNVGPDAESNDLVIHRLSEQVRGKIQMMINQALKRRKSVWGK